MIEASSLNRVVRLCQHLFYPPEKPSPGYAFRGRIDEKENERRQQVSEVEDEEEVDGSTMKGTAQSCGEDGEKSEQKDSRVEESQDEEVVREEAEGEVHDGRPSEGAGETAEGRTSLAREKVRWRR